MQQRIIPPSSEPAAATEAACREPEDFGVLLDTGLASDREWRGQRQAELQCRLERLHCLHAAARRGCVIAGLLEVLWVVSLMAATSGASEAAGVGAVCLGVALVGLLSACGVAVPVITWRRRQLLKSAKRNAIAITAPLPWEVSLDAGSDRDEHARDERVAQLEREVTQVYSDERTLTNICQFGAYAITAVWVLLGAGMCLMWIVDLAYIDLNLLGSILFGIAVIVFYVTAIVAAVALVFILFAAPGSVICEYRRRRLLRQAARLGYELRDPARFPGGG